jgi:hypothetical protein
VLSTWRSPRERPQRARSAARWCAQRRSRGRQLRSCRSRQLPTVPTMATNHAPDSRGAIRRAQTPSVVEPMNESAPASCAEDAEAAAAAVEGGAPMIGRGAPAAKAKEEGANVSSAWDRSRPRCDSERVEEASQEAALGFAGSDKSDRVPVRPRRDLSLAVPASSLGSRSFDALVLARQPTSTAAATCVSRRREYRDAARSRRARGRRRRRAPSHRGR